MTLHTFISMLSREQVLRRGMGRGKEREEREREEGEREKEEGEREEG